MTGSFSDKALENIVVAQIGSRDGVMVCGSLLAQLGAEVVMIEDASRSSAMDAQLRAVHSAGKLSLAIDRRSDADRDLLGKLLARCDVVLTSSDVDPAEFRPAADAGTQIVCDITAFGSTGPRAGEALSEAQVQAFAGLMDTTGNPDGPPTAIGVPIVGYITGTYAASAVLAALRVREQQGVSQHVEVAMFDCAFLTLNAYLSGVLTGHAEDRTRMGNRHPTVAPWNLYPTADGHVIITTGNLGQWERLCQRIDRPDLFARFETQAQRLAGVTEIDDSVADWTRQRTTQECVEAMLKANIPSGPIAPIIDYPREANIDARGMVLSLKDPASGGTLYLPASPLGLTGSPPQQPAVIPLPDEHRRQIEQLIEAPRAIRPAPGHQADRQPLAGLRVVEIGQYTTAPLTARHLAHLGAEVIKIEQPGGDAQRGWMPHVGGRSATFRLNNADKRSMVLDLRSADGQDMLRRLLATADVLVENTKPGTLSKFGFSPTQITSENPRLIYCGISGFGARSPYASRPGFDMVVQGMSGFMAAVRPESEPLKSGISTADMMGAEMGLVSILAATLYRDRTGRGQYVDLSMQDVSCWLTAPVWNRDLKSVPRPAVIATRDGYVVGDCPEPALWQKLAALGYDAEAVKALSQVEAIALFAQAGIAASEVNTIHAAATSEQAMARRVWFLVKEDGLDWPLLGSPLGLHLTPPTVRTLAPDADQDGEAIRAELELIAG
ncbi:CaiB/BaiF CoA transferase family protein [Devosia sp. A369]